MRYLNFTGIFLSVAVLTPVVSVLAQDAPPSPPSLVAPKVPTVPTTVTLRYKYQQGQVLHYKMSQDMTQHFPGVTGAPSKGVKTHSEFLVQMTVTNIRSSDGAATLTSTNDPISMTINGQPFSMPESTKTQLKKGMTITILPDGTVPKTKVGTPGLTKALGFDLGSMGSFQSNGVLPKTPIKVGEIWKTTGTVFHLPVSVQSKLGAINLVEGQTIANLNQITHAQGTISMPINGMTISAATKMDVNGLVKFNVDDGLIQSQMSDMRMSYTINMPKPTKAHPMPAGMPKTMHVDATMHITMERIPEANSSTP